GGGAAAGGNRRRGGEDPRGVPRVEGAAPWITSRGDRPHRRQTPPPEAAIAGGTQADGRGPAEAVGSGPGWKGCRGATRFVAWGAEEALIHPRQPPTPWSGIGRRARLCSLARASWSMRRATSRGTAPAPVRWFSSCS